MLKIQGDPEAEFHRDRVKRLIQKYMKNTLLILFGSIICGIVLFIAGILNFFGINLDTKKERKKLYKNNL